MRVLLKKIVSNHDRVRTNEFIGECVSSLQVGHTIVIYSDPLSAPPREPLPGEDYLRVFTSSPIRKIVGNKYFTKNSVYEIIPMEGQVVS